MWCNICFNKTSEKCVTCSQNPKYSNHFITHPATCKFGYKDCVNDPAYIYVTDPEWYEELYGDMSYEEAALDPKRSSCALCTEEYCHYDDEDK